LKSDSRVKNLETEKNTIFFLEERFERIPSAFYTKKLFFVKPVTVDLNGYEYWEVSSWKKENLSEFISNIKKEFSDVKILKIKETTLSDLYYSHLAPPLTKQQRRALELAVEHNYYGFPRKTSLKKLAKAMNVSLPTFQEHLRKAEEKIMPHLVKLLPKTP
jgi:hypothetical protein